MTKQSINRFSFLENGVTQIAWVVEDVHVAVRKFYSLTGNGPWHFYRYGKELLSVMKLYGEAVEYEFLAAVTDAGPTRLEIIQPISGDTIFRSYVEQYGYGSIQHLGLAVPNMQSALELSRRAGLSVIMEGGGHGLDGDGYFAYLDTEKIIGTTLELMERPKRRRNPLARYPEI